MPQLGPHISISAEELMNRVLGIDPYDFKGWPEYVRSLASSIAAELFLVRYNPFIDQELVRKSVSRNLTVARPTLSGEYPQILSRAIENFWLKQDADREFRDRLVEKLREFLPEKCIGINPDTLVQSATDATDLRIELPIAVLFPEKTDQIQAIVRLANEMQFGIIPRGGGTGLTGGAIPAMDRTVILSLSRFKNILSINKEDMTLCTQAGVITLDAIKATAKKGLLFTVDPASKAGSSIGGNISENSGGPFAFEYGTTIDNIQSFKMVMPRGELIEVRRKDHPGHKVFEGEKAVFEVYDCKGGLTETLELSADEIRSPGLGKDVTNKFLGGLPGVQKEGVDGIITEACFALYPQPEHSRVLCLEFFGRSMLNAMNVIKDIVGLRDKIREEGDLVKISALEEFGPKYVQAINYTTKSTTYEGEPISVLILQLDSDDQDALQSAVDTILSIAQPYDGVDIFAARDDKEAELFWEDRHKLSAISKRTSGFKVNEDIVIPLEVVPEFSTFLEDLNLIFLAKIYRKSLLSLKDISDFPFDEPKVELAFERTTSILKGKLTGSDMSDQELESQIRYLFQELRDQFPKLDSKIKAIYDKLQAQRIVIANHMHAGDGNCHVNIPVNSNDPEMLNSAYDAVDHVFKKVIELKGEITGEHGIGITKIDYLSDEKIAAIRQYKEKVDPLNILNPGKLTRREVPSPAYTFSFNRLINDLDKTAIKDKEHLIDLLRNIQTCTRCGKCKQVCPMYFPQKGLMYHPRNKNIALGALIEAIYYSQVQKGEPSPELMTRLRKLMEHCTACGRCTAVCPVKIDSAGSALQIRSFLEYKGKGGHPIKNLALGFVAKDPESRLPKVAKFLSISASAQSKAIGLIPGHWRRRIDSPLFQSKTPPMDLKNLSEDLSLATGSMFVSGTTPSQAVFYFPGCGASLFSRSIGMATLYLLHKAGVNVVMPSKHLCCGYPLLASGCAEAYNTNRHRNINDIQFKLAKASLAGLEVNTILTACGTCRESLESYTFGSELGRSLEHKDAVQYLIEHAGSLPLEALMDDSEVIYHSSCHTEWTDTPKAKAPEIYRSSLAELLGTEVTLSPGCCGESGLGAITSPSIYNKLRERKTSQLRDDLAGKRKDVPVLVGCPSCKVGIKRSIDNLKKSNRVMHTVEFLAELVGGPKWQKDFKKIVDKARRQDSLVFL
jgi:FAD/FMN-containing dehydrogenase/Fe-S oxidoreductase